MTGIWDNLKIFFPGFNDWFGTTGAPLRGGLAERTWSDTASDIWGAVKSLFEIFRNSYIICYRSTNLQSPNEWAREALERVQERWFPNEIYLSRRMEDRDFVIQRFQAHPKVESVIAAFFSVTRTTRPEALTVERFFTEHVFVLPYERTVRVPNPEPKQAFWLPLAELRRNLDTLIESLAKKGKVKLNEEYESSYQRSRVEEAQALEVWPRNIPENSGKRSEIIRGHTERRRLLREEIDARIGVNKESVRQEFFAGESIETFAEDPGIFKRRLEAYLREHFDEE